MNSLNGTAQTGKEFDPTELPDQPEDTGHTRPAPAPGLPISQDEYKRLKEEAEHAKPPRPGKEKPKASRRKTKDEKHHR
jgi:hypothetical protein